eukprot:915944-Pleurochrysis_carterae.AAC.1
MIRDHNPYIQVPYMGEILGRLIVKFLPAALAGEGRALLRELADKKVLGNEGRVIEDTMRLVKMAHWPVPVSAAHKGFNKKCKKAVAAAVATRKNDSTWEQAATDLEADRRTSFPTASGTRRAPAISRTT